MSSAVEVFWDEFGRQVVRTETCMFMLWRMPKDPDAKWNIDAERLRSGRVVGCGYREGIEDILEGRATWASWPPHLFSFVQEHIAEAMQREEFSAHEAISVVQAMNEIEAEVVEYKALERKLAKLTWHKV